MIFFKNVCTILTVFCWLAASNPLFSQNGVPTEVIKVAQRQQQDTNVAGEQEPTQIEAGQIKSGYWLLPGTKTFVKFYGALTVLARYDFTAAPDFDYVRYFTIPVNGSELAKRKRLFQLSARNSFVGFETQSDTCLGLVKTVLEIGFQSFPINPSDITSRTLQNNHWAGLYQCYVQVGRILAGQTFTTFSDIFAFPEAINFSNNCGITLLIQPMVRYTLERGKCTLMFALENPIGEWTYSQIDPLPAYQAAGLNPENPPFGTDLGKPVTPDAIFALRYSDCWGHVFLSGVVRDNRADTRGLVTAGTTVPPIFIDQRASAFGWGVNVAAKIKLGCKDNLLLKYTYGDGLGHYMLAGLYSGAIYDVDAAGVARLINQHVNGGFVSYQHWWCPNLRSNFTIAYIDFKNVPEAPPTAWRGFRSGFANLLWDPIPNLTIGIEYDYGENRFNNGTIGRMSRLYAQISRLF
ncbi:MAG: DcaP family trimeric outer membrane transporter [Chlamydiales bacterium]